LNFDAVVCKRGRRSSCLSIPYERRRSARSAFVSLLLQIRSRQIGWTGGHPLPPPAILAAVAAVVALPPSLPGCGFLSFFGATVPSQQQKRTMDRRFTPTQTRKQFYIPLTLMHYLYA